MPIPMRSSGMCPTPISVTARTDMEVMSAPSTVIAPDSRPRSAQITSANSVWPLPDTPAMPRISPDRTVRSTSCSAVIPRSLRAETPLSSRAGSPVTTLCSTLRTRSSPVMSLAISLAVAPSVGRVISLIPWRSTVRRSETASTSRSLWVMKITLRPPAANSRTTAKSSSASLAVRTAVGSSRIRTRAPRASTRRISTRCCSPTDSCQILAVGSTRRPISPMNCSVRSFRARWLTTPGVSGQPKWMFSATVIGSTSRKCWWTMPMPASMAWAGLRKSRSVPSTITWPASAR